MDLVAIRINFNRYTISRKGHTIWACSATIIFYSTTTLIAGYRNVN